MYDGANLLSFSLARMELISICVVSLFVQVERAISIFNDTNSYVEESKYASNFKASYACKLGFVQSY
jgi:hypothetical protein